MRKIRVWIALVLTLALLIPTFPTTSKAANLDPQNESSRNPRWIEYSNWMSDGWSVIKDKRYSDMVLIGTHDAGTYDLKHFSPFQVEEGLADTMHTLHYIPGVWQIAKHYAEKITFNKSVTQEVNIYNQLMEGNRYLDLRLKRFDGDGKLRTFHGMFGDDLDSIIRQIKDFIHNTDSREIVYINFNQFGSMWDMTVEDKKELGQRFYEALGEYIFTPEEFGFTKTMEELSATGKRLVINSIDEIADSVHATLKGYTIPQAQHGSQQMYWNVIPHLDSQYNSAYRTTTDQKKLDQWYQMKLQYSWVTSEDLDPVLDRLKKVDLDGALNTFNERIGRTLKDYTEESRGIIHNYMIDTGSKPEENQPNVWLRDFPDEQEVSIAIARNFGKNTSERYDTTKMLNDAYRANPTDNEVRTTLELAKGSRRTFGDLEAEFNFEQSGQDSRLFGNMRSTAPWTVLKGDLLFAKIEKIGIRTDKTLHQVVVTIGDTTSRLGENLGQYKELIMAPDEYITSVRTDRVVGSSTGGISYIKFETNKGRILEGGTKTADNLIHEVPSGWHITRLGGKAEHGIDAIGFFYEKIADISRPMMKSGTIGFNRGPSFDFIHDILYTKATPTKVTVGYSGNQIEAVGMEFTNGTVNQAGHITSNRKDFIIGRDEYLTEVVFYTQPKSNEQVVTGISMKTNKGTIMEAGSLKGSKVIDKANDGWMISGFYGQSDSTVNKVGVIYELAH